MPRRTTPTPLIRGVFDDDFDDSVGDRVATRSLIVAMTPEQQRLEVDDILRRLKRIEESVALSRVRAQTRDAGAFGEGDSLEDLARRVRRVKTLVAPHVTGRSKRRSKRRARSPVRLK